MFPNQLVPSRTFSTFVGFVLLAACINFTSSAPVKGDSAFTPAEKEALAQFKQQVLPIIPESSYVHKFAQDDQYLMNWLRAGNLKVKSAVDLLTKHLEWRKKEKIDTIEKEDWSEFKREFPAFWDSVDKEGRPILEIWLNEWKIRKAVSAGNLNKIIRFQSFGMEAVARKIYERRAQGSTITQGLILGDLKGANIIDQLCPACLPVFLGMVSNLENNYPFLMHKFYLLNMPIPFEAVLTLMKPTLRASTRDAITPYANKDQWSKVIDNSIAKDQRSSRFGGTIIRD